MDMRPIRNTLVALTLMGLVAGCSGSDDDDGESSDSDATSSTDSSASVADEWEEVALDSDCQCSDGSDYNLWVRSANPDKVLVYFRAGGACWSAETCMQDGSEGGEELYNAAIDSQDHPRPEGIFDLADERNPFADYSIVYVPYCTGDVFMGNTATTYADGLTVQHRGYVNGTAALDYLAESFPDATEVVVSGMSAGSVAAPLYGGLAWDRFPDASITVLADGSGSYPPAAAKQVADAWGTANAIPDWPENAGLSAEQWSSAPGLFVQSGRHAPGVTFARHDYAYDHVQQRFNGLLGVGSEDLMAMMDANERGIEDAGINQVSYTAPGDEHGVLEYDSFYSEEVNGATLVEWVTGLIEGESVDDVHCTECTSG